MFLNHNETSGWINCSLLALGCLVSLGLMGCQSASSAEQVQVSEAQASEAQSQEAQDSSIAQEQQQAETQEVVTTADPKREVVMKTFLESEQGAEAIAKDGYPYNQQINRDWEPVVVATIHDDTLCEDWGNFHGWSWSFDQWPDVLKAEGKIVAALPDE